MMAQNVDSMNIPSFFLMEHISVQVIIMPE